MVKKQCEICGLFNVKNRGKGARLQKTETGMRVVFHKGKLGNRMWVEETGNDGFYAEYCRSSSMNEGEGNEPDPAGTKSIILHFSDFANCPRIQSG